MEAEGAVMIRGRYSMAGIFLPTAWFTKPNADHLPLDPWNRIPDLFRSDRPTGHRLRLEEREDELERAKCRDRSVGTLHIGLTNQIDCLDCFARDW